jgi:hypothetical protein
MKPILESGGDTEITAAAAQTPKEIGVLAGAGRDQLARRGHEIDRQKVVAGQSIAAHQPTEAATQR